MSFSSTPFSFFCGSPRCGGAAAERCALTEKNDNNGGEKQTQHEKNLHVCPIGLHATQSSPQHSISSLPWPAVSLLLINADEAEVWRGRGEVLCRNRRFKKEREEYCILLRTEEKTGERKETGQGELLH